MNPIFKERLLKVGKTLGMFAFCMSLIAVTSVIFYSITSNFEDPTKVTLLILINLLAICGLIVTLIKVVKAIVKFYKWLFVEPFENNK